jgi:ribosomal protein S18 acetylase RimI-like enzyme
VSVPKFAEFQPDVRGEPLEGVRIREATVEDAGAIAALAVERDGLDPVETLAGVTRELAWIADEGAGRKVVFVAEHEGGVIGYGRAAWREYSVVDGARGVPDGWYLTGVIVAPAWRRRGVGRALVEARLTFIAERSDRAYYFASARNVVSIAMHEALGFRELARDVVAPGTTFTGEGVSFVADLIPPRRPAR